MATDVSTERLSM